MEPSEILPDKVEHALKHNINLLLAKNKDHLVNQEHIISGAVEKFHTSLQELRSFFIQSKQLHKKLNPSFYEQIEVKNMKEELQRKENLIKEQSKKLSRYRSELEVIQEAQLQALSMR